MSDTKPICREGLAVAPVRAVEPLELGLGRTEVARGELRPAQQLRQRGHVLRL